MTPADTTKASIVIGTFLVLGIALIWNAAAKRGSVRAHDVRGAYVVFTRFSSGIASLLLAAWLAYLLIVDIGKAHAQ